MTDKTPKKEDIHRCYNCGAYDEVLDIRKKELCDTCRDEKKPKTPPASKYKDLKVDDYIRIYTKEIGMFGKDCYVLGKAEGRREVLEEVEKLEKLRLCRFCDKEIPKGQLYCYGKYCLDGFLDYVLLEDVQKLKRGGEK